MAMGHDDIELNPFYKTLLTKFYEKYRLAQKKSWLICVPHHNSLKGVNISQEFVDCHVLKPSPFFKSHYTTTDNMQRSFEFEDGVIKTSLGTVNILMEELGYNEDYKPFKILVIERPLNSPAHHKSRIATRNGSDSTNKKLRITVSECETFLKSFPEHHEHMKLLQKKIKQFQSTYMVLPQYLHDAAFKLQDLVNWATQEFSEYHRRNGDFSDNIGEISESVESYILGQVHNRIFPVIRKKFGEEDDALTQRLVCLYDLGLTPDQLGVREPFCCHIPSAVVELAALDSKSSPAEKLICLKTTLELINQDVEKSIQEMYLPVYQTDVPRMTSDDLIPLLVTVLVQARPQHLESNLYYIQNFSWKLSTKDKLSFSLVTFQAAKEFLKSSELKCLRPSKNKMKKEMSLEELMKMTVKIQRRAKEGNTEMKKHSPTPIDHQLKNIAKMIEASTQEHHEWSRQKALKQNIKNCTLHEEASDEKLGDFLSSLQQSSLGFSCGKKT